MEVAILREIEKEDGMCVLIQYFRPLNRKDMVEMILDAQDCVPTVIYFLISFLLSSSSMAIIM